ncbi:MAG: nicotinate phosphoribosyltransferase [Bacteroidales bacterium]|nr:nicotinate phosphoribosyltransferase [Bacteroidales bacterium]
MNQKIPILPDVLTGLYTDFYELTMIQGYFLEGKKEEKAVFDYFFRSNPYHGGYVIFAGLENLLYLLNHYIFTPESLDYLAHQGFRDEFLKYLADFRFRGDLWSVREGEIVFPNEPIVRVEGNIMETQVIETLLLNVLNFESLVATKASRIREAAGKEALISDFGMRRAQGIAALQASRAAIIGGFNSTSNVAAALLFGLEATGTMAHSWIQSFQDELTAFRKYANLYEDHCVLLVDTYDTINSGVPNAIRVAKELEARGKKLRAIRLDSGDLTYLSRKARKMLDEAGLDYVAIIASNQLDEWIIRSLEEQGARISSFGVGTRLVTGHPDAALDGVYKISENNRRPVMKLSENIQKMTLPGKKNILRFKNGEGKFGGDAIILDEENGPVSEFYHPLFPEKKKNVKGFSFERLLTPVMTEGEIRIPKVPVQEIAAYARFRMSVLDDSHKRFENPHVYKVGISKRLMNLRDAVKKEIQRKYK